MPEQAFGHSVEENFPISSLPTGQTPPVTLDNEALAIPSPPATTESVAEGTTPVNQPVVQSFSETEQLPSLPTVLQNLAPTRSLGVSRALAQESDFLKPASTSDSSERIPSNIQKMPEQSSASSALEKFSIASLPTVQAKPVSSDAYGTDADISEAIAIQRAAPDVSQTSTPAAQQNTLVSGGSYSNREIPSSWSSIAELLGETSSAQTNRTVVQPYREDGQFEDAFPPLDLTGSSLGRADSTADGQESSSLGATISRYSTSSNTLSAYGMENPVQGASGQGMEGSKVGEDQIGSVEHPSKEEDAKNFEILAREIYSLVRQRLEIERERRGY
jgi:hypothetical protein